jgi:hypothetical protein
MSCLGVFPCVCGQTRSCDYEKAVGDTVSCLQSLIDKNMQMLSASSLCTGLLLPCSCLARVCKYHPWHVLLLRYTRLEDDV